MAYQFLTLDAELAGNSAKSTMPAYSKQSLPRITDSQVEETDGESRSLSPFFSAAPTEFNDLGLPQEQVRLLILKMLLHAGQMSGQALSSQLKVPFAIVKELLLELRQDQLIAYNRGVGHDLIYQLTEAGNEKTQRLVIRCSYAGAAPVPLSDYQNSVLQQSPRRQNVRLDDLKQAFGDLEVQPSLLIQIGQAMVSSSALLLYGSPGNGKTTLAEHLIRSFGDTIWIPRAIDADGDIIRLYDPLLHHEVALDGQTAYDRRWVCIQRPLVVVGGEFTLESLELQVNKLSGTLEAPLHWKSNGGIFLLDDLGRQRVAPREMLNRWIVPLEKRVDYFELPSGKRVQVPVEQMLVLSTNLSPANVVDEAFRRRIPYKVEMPNPSEEQFRRLLFSWANELGLDCDDHVLEHLLDRHYRGPQRGLRFCHPRDLLRQAADYCHVCGLPGRLTTELVDHVCHHYFGEIVDA